MYLYSCQEVFNWQNQACHAEDPILESQIKKKPALKCRNKGIQPPAVWEVYSSIIPGGKSQQESHRLYTSRATVAGT